jgi:hypothetical protein
LNALAASGGLVSAMFDPGGTLVLCHALEALPETGWGMLTVADVDGVELGGVFVHDRRVCGAIAADVELAEGTQPSREVLLRRTAAAVAVLGGGGARRWAAGVGKGFQPRITFSVTEVLVATLATNQRRASIAARQIQLAPWLATDAVLVAYAVDHAADDLLLPIAIGGDTSIPVRVAMELGRLGQEALVAAGCLRGRPQLVLAGVGLGDTAVAAWADTDMIYVARIGGPSAVERLLAGWAAMAEVR